MAYIAPVKLVYTNTIKQLTDKVNESIDSAVNMDADTTSKLALKDTITSVDAKIVNAKTYADTKIAAMVDSSPETLNTLNELAQALGDDPNFATTVSTRIGDNTTLINNHKDDTVAHVTAANKTSWDSKASGTHTHTELHTHTNKTVLDKLTESGGKPMYNGALIGSENVTPTSITLGSFKLVYNSTFGSLDFEVV